MALRLAMQADLSRLVKDARKRHESVRTAEGRAVILLDMVEKYEKLLPEVIYQMLDGSGFGTSDEPVPAVLALAMGQPATTVVKDALERIASRSWLYQLQLKPFDFETDEDLLAYSWILLNPPPERLHRPSCPERPGQRTSRAHGAAPHAENIQRTARAVREPGRAQELHHDHSGGRVHPAACL